MDKYRPCPSIFCLFTSGSQHPPRSTHAVYLGEDVPTKLIRIRQTHPWVNTNLRRLMRRKQRADRNFFFVFAALRPMSTAMVIAGWSVHLTTLFPGQA